jgi:pentatricopeptide repeat protein
VLPYARSRDLTAAPRVFVEMQSLGWGCGWEL